jgi:hypothetical protein
VGFVGCCDGGWEFLGERRADHVQVLVGLVARAVLEDLNADDQLVPGRSTGHGTQVADDELASAVGS